MRVGRLLRSTEGVGAESHRVAKVAQGGRSEESRGRGGAALCAGKQAGRWRRGASGAARFTRADTTCDETMEAWQASRRQAAQAGVAQAGVAQAAVAQAAVA